MRIEQLINLKAIVQTGSFSEAAENLFISQGALSKSIKALEDELHTPLLVRRRDRITLSAIGSALYENIEKIIENYNIIMQASDLYFANNTLRIGAFYDLGRCTISNAIVDYERRSNGTLSIETHECVHSKMISGIISDAYDCCLGFREFWPSNSSITCISLKQEPIVVVSRAKQDSNRTEYAFSELKDTQFCFVREDPELFQFILNEFNRNGLIPRLTMSHVRIDTIKQYISAGMRSTVHIRSLIESVFHTDAFQIADIQGSSSLTLSLAFDKSKITPTISEFIMFICSLYSVDVSDYL